MRVTLSTGTPAELSLPSTRPTRGVVLHPDIMGLRPLFDDLGARLAAEHGWAVCQPEPFPGHETASVEERFALMSQIDDATQLGLLAAGADHLAASGVGPIAVMGFCMGGMYALKAAASTGTPTAGRFDRAVAFYGMIRIPPSWEGAGQSQPIDLVAAGACPILAIVGTADPYTPPGDVDELAAAGAEVVRYEGADHGFVHDASRPAHRPADAADAWRRAAEFLAVGADGSASAG